MPDIDDRAARGAVGARAIGARADEESRDGFDRPLGGRQPDPLWRGGGDMAKALQGECEMRSSLVPCHGVDLVQDDRLNAVQHPPGPLRRDHEVEGFGGRDQDVRRAPQHGRPVGGGRVPRPYGHPNRGRLQPELGCDLGDLPKRIFQVLMDVHGQGFQR